MFVNMKWCNYGQRSTSTLLSIAQASNRLLSHVKSTQKTNGISKLVVDSSLRRVAHRQVVVNSCYFFAGICAPSELRA